jgi:hypothetical protein
LMISVGASAIAIMREGTANSMLASSNAALLAGQRALERVHWRRPPAVIADSMLEHLKPKALLEVLRLLAEKIRRRLRMRPVVGRSINHTDPTASAGCGCNDGGGLSAFRNDGLPLASAHRGAARIAASRREARPCVNFGAYGPRVICPLKGNLTGSRRRLRASRATYKCFPVPRASRTLPQGVGREGSFQKRP